jgi:hypothetical protein
MRGALLCLILLSPASAAAAGYADLGKLEREAVDDALALRGLAIDPEPQGKTIVQVHVVNLDVFLARERVPLVWANIFHRTTREHHVRRESLLQAGDRYDQDLVEETTRNLQDPSLSNVVAVLPVKSATPGMVDLLIVTRDIWSLRLNQDYEIQQGQIIYYTASLSENNLFGWRKNLAAVFVMDQGEMSFGPSYIDPNILGTRLKLQAAFSWIWARQIGEIAAGPLEGSSSHFRLEYPLWALARRWGAYSDFQHFDGVRRNFAGNSLRLVPVSDGATLSTPPTGPTAPWEYGLRTIALSSAVTRSFPRPALIQRISLGHELNLVRPFLLDDFPYPCGAPERTRFSQLVFPLSERSADLFLLYQLFTPRYRTYRDLNTFDFREDMQLGPSLSLKAGRASELVGSDKDFSLFQTSLDLTADWWGGLQSIGGSWEGRLTGNEMTDQLVQGRASLATPVLAHLVRLVAAGNVGFLFVNTRKRYFAVGGDTGLRGYPVGEFVGTGAEFIGHIEARSMALKLAFLRLGGLLFFDAGHAAADAGSLTFYDDVGFGLRLLIPQINTYSLRADWAFPLRPVPGMAAGWPGRMSFGFRQVF